MKTGRRPRSPYHGLPKKGTYRVRGLFNPPKGAQFSDSNGNQYKVDGITGQWWTRAKWEKREEEARQRREKARAARMAVKF